MAEGVHFEPFLPPRDQGRKGGSAPWLLEGKSSGQVTAGYAIAVRTHSEKPRLATRRQFGNAEELGTRADDTEPQVLTSHCSLDQGHMVAFRNPGKRLECHPWPLQRQQSESS